MATQIGKNDLLEVPAVRVVKQSSDGDMIGGINKLMGNLVQVMNQASTLLGSYGNIKDKLGITPQQQKGQIGAMRQPQGNVEPAILPTPAAPAEEVTTMEPGEKRKKAEDLFQELHDMAKPFMQMAHTMSAAQVIQMALQPETKEKIISKIAERI